MWRLKRRTTTSSSSLSICCVGSDHQAQTKAPMPRRARAKSAGPKTRRPQLCYIDPLLHVLDVASHFILAFSQAACVFGVFSAANAGATKPTARAATKTVESKVFISGPPLLDTRRKVTDYANSGRLDLLPLCDIDAITMILRT